MNVERLSKPSLLDVMAALARTDCLSDLKFMTREQYQNLSLKLQDIPAGEVAVREWNAAIQYLAQGPPVGDVETAKAQLIAALKKLG